MMNSIPLITVGLTCYNAQDTIIRAIESAQQQDWANIEVVVVDDCSEDSSIALLEEARIKFDNLRIIRHDQNKGYPSALNSIIDNAKGTYIAFFDDDDDSDPARLTKQMRRLNEYELKHQNCPLLCYTDRRVFVDGQEKPEAYVNAIGNKPEEPHGEVVADYILWHSRDKRYIWGEFGSCTLLAHKNTLKSFLFDPEFRRCAEWDLAVRIARAGGHFIAVNEPLVIQHKTPTSDKAGKKPLKYNLMLREKHKMFLKSKNVYWGAVLLAHSRFSYFRNKKWKSRLYLALACICAPHLILKEELIRRFVK
jgi:glycosyltransferase involved in cell wall biosynthesis|tara:strand:+ start:5494 stop:6417 length:924 start_codon:yes stop_codon:yes gene_type:complete